MFGDYGHGSIILALGLFLVMAHDSLIKIDSMRAVQGLRYMILMMGIFSCYNGLLYNEWFAIPYEWFSSCYDTDLESMIGNKDPKTSFTASFPQGPKGNDCVYPFGLDPTWFLDDNQVLLVQNSFKMKMAVIIGVSHMTLGVVVKGFNQIYFNRPVVFFFEVVTGLIILLGLFGWMDVLIIAKWLTPYNAYNFLLNKDGASDADKQ